MCFWKMEINECNGKYIKMDYVAKPELQIMFPGGTGLQQSFPTQSLMVVTSQ